MFLIIQLIKQYYLIIINKHNIIIIYWKKTTKKGNFIFKEEVKLICYVRGLIIEGKA
ncbi:MAG: hypothetical protein ACI9TV_000677 [Sulfurimonas sp.]|jgi:hypothetical protein